MDREPGPLRGLVAVRADELVEPVDIGALTAEFRADRRLGGLDLLRLAEAVLAFDLDMVEAMAEFVEAGIADLQRAMTEGRVPSRQLVSEYLIRIALYEDQLKAIITVNPKVLEEAEALDRERAQALNAKLNAIVTPKKTPSAARSSRNWPMLWANACGKNTTPAPST